MRRIWGPLPNIDVLMDANVGHSMFFFRDGFSVYNQIKMDPLDAKQTGFLDSHWQFSSYCHAVHSQVCWCHLPMWNDFHFSWSAAILLCWWHLVKFKEVCNHVDSVFTLCKQYNLRMNPLKCAFTAFFGKFSWFTVYRKWIDFDPTKFKAIQDIERPTTSKLLRSFIGRISYMHTFIPVLIELLEPFQKLLKKNMHFNGARSSRQLFKKSRMSSGHLLP